MINFRTLLNDNFAPLIGLFFMTLFLCNASTLTAKHKRIFIAATALFALELFATNMDFYLGNRGESLSVWRPFWSAIGYSVRPVILYLILALTTESDIRSKQFLAAGSLLIINTLLAFSVFFTDIAYSFTADNHFSRGPLGTEFYFLLFIYLSLILYALIRRRNTVSGFKQYVGYACVATSVISIILESENLGIGVSRTAVIFSLLAYFMYYQSVEYVNDHTQTTYLAEHDGLTGLYNRYAFDLQTENLTASTKPLGFLIMDIDKFKSINDLHGHETGDHVLKRVAFLLKDEFRSSDSVIRLGGDEFVVLMPGMTADMKELVIKRIESINDTLQNHPQGLPQTSVSAGLAFNERGYNDTLYKKADQALYERKNSTRCGITVVE